MKDNGRGWWWVRRPLDVRRTVLRRHRGLAWCSAAVLVALAWLVTPNPVALYDGVGLPDEPYRYVNPPIGARSTPAPTGGSLSSEVLDGSNRDFLSVTTGEFGPQAAVSLPSGAVAVPSPGPVVVRVTPVAPSEQPAGTNVDGNVYQVDVMSPAGPARFTLLAAQAAIYLRAPTQRGGEVMQYRPGPGQAWRPLPTSQAGLDVWGAALPAPGQFALTNGPAGAGSSVAADAAVPAGTPQAGGFPVLADILIGLVVFLALAVVVVRWRSADLEG